MQSLGSFTPVHALLGGLLLGLAAAAKLLLTGRVLGISGAVKGYVGGDASHWRTAFLLGMAAGGLAVAQLWPAAVLSEPYGALSVSAHLPVLHTWPSPRELSPRQPAATSRAQASRIALAGLLVGLGSAVGNGCTSGHGICGTARLSVRSLAYVVTFMATGATRRTAGLCASAPSRAAAPHARATAAPL